MVMTTHDSGLHQFPHNNNYNKHNRKTTKLKHVSNFFLSIKHNQITKNKNQTVQILSEIISTKKWTHICTYTEFGNGL